MIHLIKRKHQTKMKKIILKVLPIIYHNLLKIIMKKDLIITNKCQIQIRIKFMKMKRMSMLKEMMKMLLRVMADKSFIYKYHK
jgi:hypothetical protein